MTSQRDRNAAMDQVLRGVLGASSEAAGPACPHAEVVAAYLERALDARDRSDFERHAAACTRCQATLAALGALDPDIGVLDGTPPRPAWWRPGWRWLVPATVAATAAGVYLAVQPPAQLPARPQPEFTVATRSADAPAPHLAPAAEGVPISAPQKAMPPAGAEPGGKLESRVRTPASPAEERPASRTEASGGLAKEQRQEAAPMGVAPPPPLASASPAGMAPAPVPAANVALEKAIADEAQARAPDQRPGEADAQSARTRAEAAGAPAAGYRTTASRAEADKRGLAVEEAPLAASETVAPAGRPRWRVGAAGRIDRSDDGGATWQRQASGVREDLLAVSSPSASTCWSVGRSGVVLVTTDGERWARRSPPAAVDLIRVEAGDALAATVTTADGRRFATTDGGWTWTAR